MDIPAKAAKLTKDGENWLVFQFENSAMRDAFGVSRDRYAY
jgi:hypothetical protein